MTEEDTKQWLLVFTYKHTSEDPSPPCTHAYTRTRVHACTQIHTQENFTLWQPFTTRPVLFSNPNPKSPKTAASKGKEWIGDCASGILAEISMKCGLCWPPCPPAASGRHHECGQFSELLTSVCSWPSWARTPTVCPKTLCLTHAPQSFTAGSPLLSVFPVVSKESDGWSSKLSLSLSLYFN